MNFRIERFNFLKTITDFNISIIDNVFGDNFTTQKPIASFFINAFSMYSFFVFISSILYSFVNTDLIYHSNLHQYCLDVNEITNSISFYNMLGLSSIFCSFCSVKERASQYSTR